jgi:hypothetical protein
MSTRTSFAVHGAAFQPLFPADFLEQPSAAAPQARFVERGVRGATFKALPGTSQFYVIVPSPAILVDYQMAPTSIILYYETDSSTIRRVSLLDGNNPIATFPVNWSGTHLTYDFNSNLVRLTGGAPPISRGLMVLVDVDFAVSQNPQASTYASVTFASLSVTLASGESWYANLINSVATKFQM